MTDTIRALQATPMQPCLSQKCPDFTGVLHLHGRLADSRPELGLNETDLVLTSSEFGDAYLRSWLGLPLYL